MLKPEAATPRFAMLRYFDTDTPPLRHFLHAISHWPYDTPDIYDTTLMLPMFRFRHIITPLILPLPYAFSADLRHIADANIA